MSDQPKRNACMGLTRRGQPCKNLALPGSQYCRFHQALPDGPEDRRGKTVYEEAAPQDQTASGAESDETMRQQLLEELDQLIERVHEIAPDYNPPSFSPQNLLELIEKNLQKLSPDFVQGILTRLRGSINSDLFDLDTWKGVWTMLNYTLEYEGDLIKHRITGEYETDEWGFDREYLEAVKPFFDFLYKVYWRVQTHGIENIPETGRALLVVNHSGQLPWDGAMVANAVMSEHPAQRLVRTLVADWFPRLPFISQMFVKCGQILATEDNGRRLLEQDELVAVYPEGYKGVGKLFKDRYKLARFGRGGFIKTALRTRSPIIPTCVVGAEETYISLAKSETLAKLIGFPFFPISPTFPWTGLFGFIPLPTRWSIDFGAPLPMGDYPQEAADDLGLVSQLTDQVRNMIQEMIYARLEQRQSVFF
jgi:1-acyl-sn-glycerol-3-phosphate acyltransferase